MLHFGQSFTLTQTGEVWGVFTSLSSVFPISKASPCFFFKRNFYSMSARHLPMWAVWVENISQD